MRCIIKNKLLVNGINPIYLIVLIAFAVSCKKDKVSKECQDLDYSQLHNVIGGPHSKSIGEQLRTPSFNPNNDNEIMFVRESTGSQDKEIYIYNLGDKSIELIYEGDLWGRPSWGKNDYIIFYRKGGHIWKIRSDGENLTYLNNPFEVYNPQWNSEGTKFAANRPVYQAPNQLIIFNENGTVLDSIPLPFMNNYIGVFNSSSSFEREDVLVLRRFTNITFYDLKKEEIIEGPYHTQLGFSNQTSASGNIFWLDSSKLIYGNRNGIHQITYPELQNTHLVKGCTSRYFSSGSLNSSKTKMVWGVVEREINEHKTHINVKRYLVIMGVDGSNEQRLEITF